jgi:hypothetical protein
MDHFKFFFQTWVASTKPAKKMIKNRTICQIIPLENLDKNQPVITLQFNVVEGQGA